VVDFRKPRKSRHSTIEHQTLRRERRLKYARNQQGTSHLQTGQAGPGRHGAWTGGAQNSAILAAETPGK